MGIYDSLFHESFKGPNTPERRAEMEALGFDPDSEADVDEFLDLTDTNPHGTLEGTELNWFDRLDFWLHGEGWPK